MKIFDKLNFLNNENQIIGLNAFKNSEKSSTQKIYTGDYSTMFKFNLNNSINPSVGQNLYFLS